MGDYCYQLTFQLPFFFAAGISLLSIILVIAFLPESLSKREEKLAFKVGDMIPIKEAKYFFKSTITRGLILAFFIYNLGFFLFMNSSALFAYKQIYATAQEVAFYMAWIGVLRVIFQSILINPLLKKFSENKTLGMGIFSMIFAMVFLIFSSTYWIVYVPYFFIAFGTGVARPILTSKLTNAVKREEAGSILGVNNSLTSIGQIISPILGGVIINYLPSQTLPTISALIFVLMIVLWKWLIARDEKE